MISIIFILKALWLCFTVYFLIKDSIMGYITVQTFLTTAGCRELAEKVPGNIAMRVVNVVLSLIIFFYA